MSENSSKLLVNGAILQGYAQACVNLNIVAGSNATRIISGIDMAQWYPFERWTEIENIVIQSYKHSGAILERAGMEMMLAWYHYGPGKDIVKTGFDFLHYQSGSNGYCSVVHGPKELVGDFKLIEVNKEKGRAILHSTTPMDRNAERGVLIGGMSAPGDLDYIDVINTEDKDYFMIEFH